MPPMARMDEFARCFLDIPEGATATFCMVTSLIKPNETSDIWRIVNVCTIDFSKKNVPHNNSNAFGNFCFVLI